MRRLRSTGAFSGSGAISEACGAPVFHAPVFHGYALRGDSGAAIVETGPSPRALRRVFILIVRARVCNRETTRAVDQRAARPCTVPNPSVRAHRDAAASGNEERAREERCRSAQARNTFPMNAILHAMDVYNFYGRCPAVWFTFCASR